jgi:hypothetical protein
VDRSDNAQLCVSVFKRALIDRLCRTAINEGLKKNNAEQEGVLNTLLDPDSFALLRSIVESQM